MKVDLGSLTLFLIILAGPSAFAQNGPAPKTDVFVAKEAIEASIKGVPCATELRLEGVKKLFMAAGAPEGEIKIEELDKGKISNLVVRKKGETDETIVIGAHYDRTNSGCGVTDNWSGITIIAHLYESLRTLDTKKSYIFAAFDKEEVGLKGSAAMIKAMSADDLAKVCLMVNFDSFGQAYPMALQNATSPKLLKLAESLGKESGFKFNSVEIQGASSDSASFRDKKIPAITLSGLGGDWANILHSSADKVEKVNIDSVYLGYRFGLLYLSKLDAAGCQDYR